MVSFEPMLFWVCSRSRFLASADNSFYRLTIFVKLLAEGMAIVSFSIASDGDAVSIPHPPKKKQRRLPVQGGTRDGGVGFSSGLGSVSWQKELMDFDGEQKHGVCGFCEMDVMDVDVCIYLYT